MRTSSHIIQFVHSSVLIHTASTSNLVHAAMMGSRRDGDLENQRRVVQMVKERPILYQSKWAGKRPRAAMMQAREEIAEAIGVWSAERVRDEWSKIRQKYHMIRKRMESGEQQQTYFALFADVHEFLSEDPCKADASTVLGTSESSGSSAPRRTIHINSIAQEVEVADGSSDSDESTKQQGEDSEHETGGKSDSIEFLDPGVANERKSQKSGHRGQTGSSVSTGASGRGYGSAPLPPQRSSLCHVADQLKRSSDDQSVDADMSPAFKAPYGGGGGNSSGSGAAGSGPVAAREQLPEHWTVRGTGPRDGAKAGSAYPSAGGASSARHTTDSDAGAATSTVCFSPGAVSTAGLDLPADAFRPMSSNLPGGGGFESQSASSESIDPFLKFVGDMLVKMSEERRKDTKMRICNLLL
eukprot:scpid39669/ scgid27356/ 